MKLSPLGEMDLTYVGPSVDFVDYGEGGQFYGTMEGSWRSDRISGTLRLTNIAQKRTDTVNTPTLRGVLRTEDGATMFVEMNGLSQIQEGGRVFIASLTLRTAHTGYQWVNTLFAVVEGELHGAPRPNEFRAHCRVYACEATITPRPRGGDETMSLSAYALPIIPGKGDELRALVRGLEQRAAEHDTYRRSIGIRREAVFLQNTAVGDQVITYREIAGEPVPGDAAPDAFEAWYRDRLTSLHGFYPTAVAPKAEVLIRQRPPHPGGLYAAALPLLPNKTARLHEFAAELNGIHSEEFVESLRRLRFGLTLFLQYTPPLDLAISVVEGKDPASALGRLAGSPHPFDRWHIQQIADQTGLDLGAPPPPPNELLWMWEETPVRAGA